MEGKKGQGEERTTIWQELDTWAADLRPWEHFVLATAVRERELSEELSGNPLVTLASSN